MKTMEMELQCLLQDALIWLDGTREFTIIPPGPEWASRARALLGASQQQFFCHQRLFGSRRCEQQCEFCASGSSMTPTPSIPSGHSGEETA